MKALVLHAVDDARCEFVCAPEPKQGQVRIRVGYCGVCNSDLLRFFGKGPYAFPLICGHEFAGVVDKLGPGVEIFAPGDRVTVFPLLWCGQCGPCEERLYAKCLNYNYLGSRTDGAFAEFVIAPVQNLLRLPDGISLEEAALCEPAAVALHALRGTGGCSLGDVVAVFGAGPIGLLVAQWGRAMGASIVIVVDVISEKLAIADELGFKYLVDGRKQDPVEAVNKLTGGLGADVCVDAAGVPVTTRQSLQGASRGGRAVLLGNPSADVLLPVSLISQTLRREVCIHGTWNSEYSVFAHDDDWHRSIAGMLSGTIRVKPLISHKLSLDRAFEALRRMRESREWYCKVLINPGAGGE